jgi:hypothetical protein
LIGVEWGVLLAVTLAFSPQTNSRHLSLLLPACVAASAILLPFRRRPYQVALVAGLLVMVLGINLPPGGPRFAEMLGGWQSAGGPAWCVLMMAMTLAYAGVARAADLSRSDSSHTSIA